MRWLVERKRDDFEDVGADSVRVEYGCLVFRNGLNDSEPIYILAAGEWTTVVPDEAVDNRSKPEVWEHFVTSTDPTGIKDAACGKVWRPVTDVDVIGRCPDCIAIADSGWWIA